MVIPSGVIGDLAAAFLDFANFTGVRYPYLAVDGLALSPKL